MITHPRSITELRHSGSAPVRIIADPRRRIRETLFVVGSLSTLAFVVLTAIVIMHPLLAIDVSLERAIQSVNWGPLAWAFPVSSFLGDVKGTLVAAGVVLLVLVFNHPAWRLTLAGFGASLVYIAINFLVTRPRPSVPIVLHVTEHPAASSYPSGHMVFFITLTVILMLTLGRRYLPRPAQPVGWVIVAILLFAGAISRIYTGAHWPTDVLAGILIATAWLSFVIAIPWISNPVYRRSV